VENGNVSGIIFCLRSVVQLVADNE